jgi:glutaredoxin-related protein
MENDLEYTFVNTDFSPSYRSHIKKTFQWKTMPVIVVWSDTDQQLVGGYDDLVYIIEKGPMEGT